MGLGVVSSDSEYDEYYDDVWEENDPGSTCHLKFSPSTPKTWICLTTAGSEAKPSTWNTAALDLPSLPLPSPPLLSPSPGIAPHGGNISMDKCNNVSKSMEWVGWVGVAIAVGFFGSNFIPVKKFDTGDGKTSAKLSPSLSPPPSLPLSLPSPSFSLGMFFQWVLCIGIWLVGLVVNIARVQPPFFLPTLFGGFLWTTGNRLCAGLVTDGRGLSLPLPLQVTLWQCQL